jgi:hypothetical protein
MKSKAIRHVKLPGAPGVRQSPEILPTLTPQEQQEREQFESELAPFLLRVLISHGVNLPMASMSHGITSPRFQDWRSTRTGFAPAKAARREAFALPSPHPHTY